MAPSATHTQVPSIDVPVVPDIKKILSDSRLSPSDVKLIYGDFRDDLVRDGYAVIKGAIPLVRAEDYGRDFYDFLESL
jgi:hypothetical protein